MTNYVFRKEPLTKNLEAIKPMLEANHYETGLYDLPFNPDYERYLQQDWAGNLAFFTVREIATDAIVGFALFFLDTEIQQQNVRSATQSLNYIDKKHRGMGYSFMKFCDDILKKQGVNSVWRQATVKFDVGRIYERMGYRPVETSYLKRL